MTARRRLAYRLLALLAFDPHLRASVACALVTLALAPGLLAQEEPTPSSAPVEPATVEVGLETPSRRSPPARSNTMTPRWQVSLGASTGYDTNARFSTVDGEGDASGRLRASLERTFSWPRGRLSLRGEGSGRAYLRLDDLNAFGYAGEVLGAFEPTPAWTFGLDQSYRGDLSRSLRGLIDTGQLIEQVFTRTYNGRAHAAWRATTEVIPRVEVSYESYTFESSDLSGGSQLTARLAVDTRKTESQLTMGYEFRLQNAKDGPTSLTGNGSSHNASLTWMPPRKAGFTAFLTLGLLHMRPVGEGVSSSTTPSGGLNVGYKAGRHNLSAAFNRSVGLAYALGTSTVSNTLTLNETYNWMPRLSFGVSALGVLSRDPINEANVYRTAGAGANANWRVSPRVTLSPAYFFYRYTQGEAGVLNNHTLILSVTHSREWQ